MRDGDFTTTRADTSLRVCVCNMAHFFRWEGRDTRGRGLRKTNSGGGMRRTVISRALLLCIVPSSFDNVHQLPGAVAARSTATDESFRSSRAIEEAQTSITGLI